jgi:hypothetical protein
MPLCTWKRIATALAVLQCASIPAFPYGDVHFANTGNLDFRLWTNNASGTASNLMSGLNRYRIGLYGSLNLEASESSLQLVGLATNSGIVSGSGYFSGGNPLTLPDGYFEGANLRFQLRAWTLTAGTSFAEASLNSQINPLEVALGRSPISTTTLGGGTVIAGFLFGTSGWALRRGFQIAPIPEPSSIALGLLGLGAMTLFRRRTSK